MIVNLVSGPVPPMLATAVPEVFDSPDYLYEPKWDGYRAIAFLDRSTSLQSRRLRDMTGEFPELKGMNQSLRAGQATLDGEIVSFSEGRPSFQALQHRSGRVVYIAFDILCVDYEAVTGRPLSERKALLEQVVETGDAVAVPECCRGTGKALFDAVSREGLEGIVAKRAGSPYVPGERSRDWLKVKVKRTVDCVIGGISRGVGTAVGSVALGLYEEGALLYVGHAGTGFNEAERQEILRSVRAADGPPFAIEGRGLPAELRQTAWVRPDLVCEVCYTEMTRDLKLRHPSFVRLRSDKSPSDCTLDQIGGGAH